MTVETRGKGVRDTVAMVFGVVLSVISITQAARGQGVITDGPDPARFELLDSATAGLADFQADGDTSEDHLFQSWWWYRVRDDSHEHAFPWPPPQQVYVANTAMLGWRESSFDARLTLVLHDGILPGEVTLSEGMSITNTGAVDLEIDLFKYVDLDVGASTENSATLLETGRMEIIDDLSPATAEFLGFEADAYQVTVFETLLNALQDESVTNLDDTGLPFVSNDFTGAFQWTLVVPAGETRTVLCGLSVNSPAVAGPILVARGSCPGSLTVEMHGATPEQDISLLYGFNRGPWTNPSGRCAGETFLVAPPFLPGSPLTLMTDARGFATATTSVPASACGRLIVQGVDQTSCLTSNPIAF